MKMYCLINESDGRINSRRYFSSKEKVIEWLDNFIMLMYKEYLEQGAIQFDNFVLTIHWLWLDKYYIDEIWLDPKCPHLNCDKQYIPFID